MKYIVANGFWERFKLLPSEIQKAAREKFNLFSMDWRHPSLRTRKMPGKDEVWEGHISMGYVFTFRYSERDGETVIETLDIGKHDTVYDRN